MDNSFKLRIQDVFKLSTLIGLNVGNEINNPVKIFKGLKSVLLWQR